MATKKSKKKTQTRKKKMTIEAPPQSHEVLVHVAQDMLGYDSAASVRKLRQLGHIEGRQIGRDVWYDTRSIKKYMAARRPAGRPREEAPRRKRLTGEEKQRIAWREAQRRSRANRAEGGASAKRAAKKAAKKGAKKGRR